MGDWKSDIRLMECYHHGQEAKIISLSIEGRICIQVTH